MSTDPNDSPWCRARTFWKGSKPGFPGHVARVRGRCYAVCVVFFLIIPALEAAEERYGEGIIPALIAVIGILSGMALIALLNEALPHQHFSTGREGPQGAVLRKIWLFIIAITIHNFPEGLAVGVGFGAHGLSGGMPLAIGPSWPEAAYLGFIWNKS